MPEGLSLALSTPGLGWLIGAVVVAGLVRGFAGFGTAMVYVPAAAQVVSPVTALVTMAVMDLIGPTPNVPRAMRDGHLRDLMRLCLGMAVALPIGIMVLTSIPGDVFRYAVSGLALILVTALIAGVRYRGALTCGLTYGTGALGGFLGGAVGLAGPPVIFLYMASRQGAAVIRANTLLFLWISDFALMAMLGSSGFLSSAALWLGAVLCVPYTLANVAGAAVFRPQHERVYRIVAYTIIAGSAISGLPLWRG